MNYAAIVNMLLQSGANLITLLRHSDGSLTVVQILDADSQQAADNLKQAADFLKSKQPPTA